MPVHQTAELRAVVEDQIENVISSATRLCQKTIVNLIPTQQELPALPASSSHPIVTYPNFLSKLSPKLNFIVNTCLSLPAYFHDIAGSFPQSTTRLIELSATPTSSLHLQPLP